METIIGDLEHGRGYFIEERVLTLRHTSALILRVRRPYGNAAGQLESDPSLCGSPPYGNIRGLPWAMV